MKILEFLAELATDSELMAAYRNDPHAALSTTGLSEEDRSLLLSGNPIALRYAVSAGTRASSPPRASRNGAVLMEMIPSPEPPPPQPPEMIEPPEMTPPPPAAPEMIEPPEMTPPPAAPEMIPPPKQLAAFPPAVMMEEFPRPGEPEEEPRPAPEMSVIPELVRPSRFAGLPQEAMMEELPRPDKPEEPEEPETAVAHEAESHQVEPLDIDLDLAQDAVLAGLSSGRAVDREPGGVWSAKGLTLVGMGMRAGLHMTVETRLAIEHSAKVLYLVADPVSEACIRKLNPAAEPLGHLYQVGKPRIEIYETIIARILSELETHGDVCVAFYGHPGVLAYPAWESIRRARATGKRARMLPAISTEDCLFADLGIDIGRAGLQSFEATRFLYYSFNFDSTVGLLLWQVSVLGENEWNPPHPGVRPRLEVLTDYLLKFYPPEHEVFLYHAPEYPTSRPLVERLKLQALPRAEHIAISTLYIPPSGQPPRNEANIQALARVGARQ